MALVFYNICNMARGKPTNEKVRELIIKYYNLKRSYSEIGNILNLSKATVQSVIKNYTQSGSVAPKKQQNGPKSAITARDIRALQTIIKENRRSSIRTLSAIWSEKIGKSVGREWTRIHLHKLEYSFYKAKKKPFLTDIQKRKRLSWAKEKQTWVQRQWDSVIFSDESRFEICVGDSRSRVIRKKTEMYHRDCMRRQVKFPASVMVWGCMSAKGVGSLKFIDGTVNASNYIDILQSHLIPSVTRLCYADEFIFQQDGAAPHTARSTRAWLQNNNVNVLDWPSSSPDLNPIESLWAIMKRRLRNEPQRTISGLKQKIREIWDSITPHECRKLIDSMPLRASEVIKAKGDVTKY